MEHLENQTNHHEELKPPGDEYLLTKDELAMLQPLVDTINQVQNDANAILRSISRIRGLEGRWNLVGDRLIKTREA